MHASNIRVGTCIKNKYVHNITSKYIILQTHYGYHNITYYCLCTSHRTVKFFSRPIRCKKI